MTKIPFLALAFAAAAAAFAQDAASGDVITPGGIHIEPERVYVTSKSGDSADKADWLDSRLEFSHGNASLRFRLTSANAMTQTLHAQFPLAIGGRTITLAAGKETAPGEMCEWNIPLPMIGRISFVLDEKSALSHSRLADSAGEFRNAYALTRFGYNATRSALYSPIGEIVADDAISAKDEGRCAHIAISPATARFNLSAEYFRAIKARAQRTDAAVAVEKPDFSRFRRWQDLSVYDMIVIDEDDWAGYPQTLKAILPDWVAAGGTLALIGTQEPPISPGSCGLGKVVALGASSPDFEGLFKTFASTMNRYSLATSPFDCDIKASDAVGALRNETPFSIILIVLLTFCVLAGPVLVITLAKRNRRLNLLWVFPIMAVVFSLGVMSVIVCVKGIDPELRQFVHTVYDEKAGKVVTICNHVILAPFTLQGDVRLDAKDSLVSYMSGDVNRCGDTIIYTGKEFVFRDGWVPTLWPVVFRTVSVRPVSDAPDAPPMPISGRLQEHYVSATEERRTAK